MTEIYGDGGLVLERARVAVLTLNRPTRRNAMTRAMWSDLPVLCDSIAADRSIRVLIVTGQGEAAFCAGADISEFSSVYETQASSDAYNAIVRTAQARLRDLRCPVIAAIRGACYGGGCGLALACDLRFADAKASFAITPARLGLVYSPEDTWQLIEKVGVARAKDMLLSGRTVPAPEALSIGLIDQIAEDDVGDQARAYANGLADLAPRALAGIKAIVNGLSLPDPTKGLHETFAASFGSAEFREGYSAFLEKRAADFSKDGE